MLVEARGAMQAEREVVVRAHPLGGVILHRHFQLFEGMRKHERPEDGHVARRRLRTAPFCPVEKLQEGRRQPVPHLLDGIDVEVAK